MWRNLPFFLLWVLGCLQRLCPSQGSWSSREESHALCWVWWPRYKRRVGVHADPSGHFSHSPLLLWVKGNHSWSPAPPKKVQGRSSGKSSGMWWNWEEAQWGWKWWLEGDVQPVGFLDLTSAGTQGALGPCIPLTMCRVSTAPRPEAVHQIQLYSPTSEGF